MSEPQKEKPRVNEGTEERMDETERLQGVRRMHALVGTMFALLIFFQLNYLAFRHFERWDWTSDARFTLSERTVTELRGLDRDVDFWLLLSEGEPAFADVRELLERYRAASPRVRVHHVDPDASPGEMRRVAERFDIALSTGEGESFADVALVVSSADRRWKITRDDLVSLDLESFEDDAGGPKVDVKAERAISGALAQVLRGRPTKICVATGRGEAAMAGDRPMFFLREELERENAVLEDFDAVGLREVPEGCDAVFVIGPQRPWEERDARKLVEWARAGGNLLLALDPVFAREAIQATGFEAPIQDLGVSIDRDVVLEMDPRLLLRRDPSDLFRVMIFGEHPTTAALMARGGGLAMNLVRSVRVEEGADATALFTSSESAFGETDLGGLVADADLLAGPEDLPGPLSLGAALELPPIPSAGEAARRGRLVVVGDSDWLAPELLREPAFANVDFFLSVTGWLTERDELLEIAPRRSNLQAVVMSEGDVSGVAWRIFAFLPGALFLLGFAVWWSRRQ
ncbi:MAG: GldG family protein [Sandaracinus sp.]|nr:GldG family protein [Sandaracinus sp.]MCB9615366.1 GldG family protein [Sandaracinus sp.]MCB9634964.1 GldG family protein [Sandaracinus sp.]